MPSQPVKVDVIEQVPNVVVVVEEEKMKKSEKGVNDAQMEIVPEIVVQKTQVSEQSRQSRSPNRVVDEANIIVGTSVNVDLLGATSSVPRTRSRSPIWSPGNTSYANVLKGLEVSDSPHSVGFVESAPIEAPREASPRPPRRKHQVEQKSFQPSSEMQTTKWSPSHDTTVTRRDDKPRIDLVAPVPVHRGAAARKSDSDSSPEIQKDDAAKKKPQRKSRSRNKKDYKDMPQQLDEESPQPEILQEKPEEIKAIEEVPSAVEPQKPSRKKSKKQKKTQDVQPTTEEQLIMRKITIIRKKIIRRITIVDGRQHVSEEVVEEPVEVEVLGDGVPPTLDPEIVTIEETPTMENTKIDDTNLAVQPPIGVVEHITRTITIIRKKIIRHITIIDGKEHVTEEVIEEPVEMEVSGEEIPFLEPEIVLVEEKLTQSEPIQDSISMDPVAESSHASVQVDDSQKSNEIVDKNDLKSTNNATQPEIDVQAIEEVTELTKAPEQIKHVENEEKTITEEPKKPQREKGKSKKKKDKKVEEKSVLEFKEPIEGLSEQITKFVTIIKKKIIRHVRIVDGQEQVTEEVVEEPAQVEIIGDELPMLEPEIVTSYVEEKIEFKPISESEIADRKSVSPLPEMPKEGVLKHPEEGIEDKKKPKRKKDKKVKIAEVPEILNEPKIEDQFVVEELRESSIVEKLEEPKESEIIAKDTVEEKIPEKEIESVENVQQDQHVSEKEIPAEVPVVEAPSKPAYAGLPLDDTSDAWMDAEIVISDEEEEPTMIDKFLENPTQIEKEIKEISFVEKVVEQPIAENSVNVNEEIIEEIAVEAPMNPPQTEENLQTSDSVEKENAETPAQADGQDLRWDNEQLDSIPEGEETEDFPAILPEEKTVTQSIVDLDNKKVFVKKKHVKKTIKLVDGQEQVTEEIDEEPTEYELTGEEIPVFRDDSVTLVHKDHLQEFSKAFPDVQESEDASIIQTVVRQVTRKVTRRVTKVIRNVTIIDGKEHVSEEVIEVPEEVEITEDDPEYQTEIISGDMEKPLWKYIVIQSPEENVERTIVVNKVNVIRNIVIKDGKKSVIEEHIDEPVEIKVTQEEMPIYDAEIIMLIEQNAPEIIKSRIPYGENEEVEDVIVELTETTPSVLFEVPEIPHKLTNGKIESDIVEEVKVESAKILDDVNNEEKTEGSTSNLEFIVTKSYKVNPEAFTGSEDQVELEPIVLDATSPTEKRKKSVQFDDIVTVIAETSQSSEAEDVNLLGERMAPKINVGQLKEDLDVGQNESVPEIASYIEQRETQQIFIDPVPFMSVEFPEICAEFTLAADLAEDEKVEVPEVIDREESQPVKDQLINLQNVHADLANATTYNAFLDAEREFYKTQKPQEKQTLSQQITKIITIIRKKIIRHVKIVDGKEQVTEEIIEEPVEVEVIGDEVPILEPEIVVSYVEEKVESPSVESQLLIQEPEKEIIQDLPLESQEEKEILQDVPIPEVIQKEEIKIELIQEPVKEENIPEEIETVRETIFIENSKTVEIASKEPTKETIEITTKEVVEKLPEIVEEFLPIAEEEKLAPTEEIAQPKETVEKVLEKSEEKTEIVEEIAKESEPSSEKIIQDTVLHEKTTVSPLEVPHFDVLSFSEAERNYYLYLNTAQNIPKQIEENAFTVPETAEEEEIIVVEEKEPETIVKDNSAALNVTNESSFTENDRSMEEIEVKQVPQIEETIQQQVEELPVIAKPEEPEISEKITEVLESPAKEIPAVVEAPVAKEPPKPAYAGLPLDDTSDDWMDAEIAFSDDEEAPLPIQSSQQPQEKVIQIVTIMREKIIRRIKIINGQEQVTEEIVREPMEIEVVDGDIPDFKPEIVIIQEGDVVDHAPKSPEPIAIIDLTTEEEEVVEPKIPEKEEVKPAKGDISVYLQNLQADLANTATYNAFLDAERDFYKTQKPQEKPTTTQQITKIITIIRKKIIRHVKIVDGKEQITEEIIEEPVEVEVVGDEVPILEPEIVISYVEEKIETAPKEDFTMKIEDQPVKGIVEVIEEKIPEKVDLIDSNAKPETETDKNIKESEIIKDEKVIKDIKPSEDKIEILEEIKTESQEILLEPQTKETVVETEIIVKEIEKEAHDIPEKVEEIIPEEIELAQEAIPLEEPKVEETQPEQKVSDLQVEEIIQTPTETQTESVVEQIKRTITIIRKRIIRHVTIVNGKENITEEVIEEPVEVEVVGEEIPILEPEIEIREVKEVEPVKEIVEALIPSEVISDEKIDVEIQQPSVKEEVTVTETVNDDGTKTETIVRETKVITIIRKRIIRHVVIVDGKEEVREEVIEEPVEIEVSGDENFSLEDYLPEGEEYETVENVTEQVIRSGKKIIQHIEIIDGKEHITEEVIDLPEEIEIIEQSSPSDTSLEIIPKEAVEEIPQKEVECTEKVTEVQEIPAVAEVPVAEAPSKPTYAGLPLDDTSDAWMDVEEMKFSDDEPEIPQNVSSKENDRSVGEIEVAATLPVEEKPKEVEKLEEKLPEVEIQPEILVERSQSVVEIEIGDSKMLDKFLEQERLAHLPKDTKESNLSADAKEFVPLVKTKPTEEKLQEQPIEVKEIQEPDVEVQIAEELIDKPVGVVIDEKASVVVEEKSIPQEPKKSPEEQLREKMLFEEKKKQKREKRGKIKSTDEVKAESSSPELLRDSSSEKSFEHISAWGLPGDKTYAEVVAENLPRGRVPHKLRPERPSREETSEDDSLFTPKTPSEISQTEEQVIEREPGEEIKELVVTQEVPNYDENFSWYDAIVEQEKLISSAHPEEPQTIEIPTENIPSEPPRVVEQPKQEEISSQPEQPKSWASIVGSFVTNLFDSSSKPPETKPTVSHEKVPQEKASSSDSAKSSSDSDDKKLPSGVGKEKPEKKAPAKEAEEKKKQKKKSKKGKLSEEKSPSAEKVEDNDWIILSPASVEANVEKPSEPEPKPHEELIPEKTEPKKEKQRKKKEKKSATPEIKSEEIIQEPIKIEEITQQTPSVVEEVKEETPEEKPSKKSKKKSKKNKKEPEKQPSSESFEQDWVDLRKSEEQESPEEKIQPEEETKVTRIVTIIRKKIIRYVIVENGVERVKEEIVEEPVEVEVSGDELPILEPEIVTIDQSPSAPEDEEPFFADEPTREISPIKTEEIPSPKTEEITSLITEESPQTIPPETQSLPDKITEQITQKITITRKKIIRYITIIDGKEQVNEEVVEEPFEIEVVGGEIPVLEPEIIVVKELELEPLSREKLSSAEPEETSKTDGKLEVATEIVIAGSAEIPIEAEPIVETKETKSEELLTTVVTDVPEIPNEDSEKPKKKKNKKDKKKNEKSKEESPGKPDNDMPKLDDKPLLEEDTKIADLANPATYNAFLDAERDFYKTQKPQEKPTTTQQITKIITIIRKKIIRYVKIVDGKEQVTEEIIEEPVEVEVVGDEVPILEPEIVVCYVEEKVESPSVESELLIKEPQKEIIQDLPLESQEEKVVLQDVSIPEVTQKEEIKIDIIQEPIKEENIPEEIELAQEAIPLEEPNVVETQPEQKDSDLQVEEIIQTPTETETQTESVVEQIKRTITIIRKRIIRHVTIVNGKENITEEVIEEPVEVEVVGEEIPILEPEIEIREVKEVEPVKDIVEALIPSKVIPDEKIDVEIQPPSVKEEVTVTETLNEDGTKTETIVRETKVITIIRKRIIRHVVIVDGKEEVREEVIEEPVEIEVSGDENFSLEDYLPEGEEYETVENVTEQVIRSGKKIIQHIDIIDGKEHITEEVIDLPEEIEIIEQSSPSDTSLEIIPKEAVEEIPQKEVESTEKATEVQEIPAVVEVPVAEALSKPAYAGLPLDDTSDAWMDVEEMAFSDDEPEIPQNVSSKENDRSVGEIEVAATLPVEEKPKEVEKLEEKLPEVEIQPEILVERSQSVVEIEIGDSKMLDKFLEQERLAYLPKDTKESNLSADAKEFVPKPVEEKQIQEQVQIMEEKKVYAGLPLDETSDDWMIVDEMTFSDEEKPSETETKKSDTCPVKETISVIEEISHDVLPPTKESVPVEMSRVNVHFETDFWPNKYLYDDAEEAFVISQKAPQVDVVDPELVLRRNILEDLSPIVGIPLLSDAECLWQTLLSRERPKQVVDVEVDEVAKEGKDDDDDDDDEDKGRLSDSQEPLVVNVDAHGSITRETKGHWDIPNGGKWRGESTYLSIESTGDYPETAHESEQHPIQLESTTNITQTPPPSPTHTPILDNPPEFFPPESLSHAGISDRIIAHSSEPLVVTEPTDISVQTNKKDAVAREIDQLLASIAGTERDLVNLSNEDLAKMLEKLREILEALKTHDTEASAIKENVSADEPDQEVDASLTMIDTKIEKLVTRATKAFALVEDAINQQQMRQLELKKYSQLQQEIENWLSSIEIPSAKVSQEINTVDGIQEIIADQQKLIDDITDKEQKLEEIRDKCQEMQKQQHVKKLATTLTEQFTIILTLLETRKQSTLNYITKLRVREDELVREKKDDDKDTLESMSMPEEEPDAQKMTIETQTSVQEERRKDAPQADDETQTSFPLIEGTPRDTQSAFVQTQQDRRPTDNIIVLHTSDEEKETIEIDNQLNQPIPKDERPSDVLVEAKFNQTHPGSGARTSELVLRNVPQSFETTFIEPDETTTEVVVDSDGTKRIIVRKVKRTHVQREVVMQSVTVGAESIPIVQEETIVEEIPLAIEEEPAVGQPGRDSSTIETIVKHVTRKIVRKTRKIIKKVTIIDGKEHVTEEVVEEPEEVEISEEELPNVNINLLRGVEEFTELPVGESVKKTTEEFLQKSVEEASRKSSGEPSRKSPEEAAKKVAEEEKDEDTFEIVKSDELEKESSKGSSRKASGSDDKMKGEGDEKVLECQRAPVDLVTATAHVDENQPNVEIADTNVRREEECPSEFPQPVGTSTAIPQVHATDDEVEGSTAPHKELIVTDIKEIWPPTETIDEIPVHLLDTITHDDTKNAIDHTTDEIWPTNPDIGADVDLQRYGVSVTVVEHVIETVEKHPEEKSLEISQKAPIDELKVTAAVVEASPETSGEDRKKVQGDKPPPSEQEKPREAPDTPKVHKEEKTSGQEPPSEPSTPQEKSEAPEESHAVGDEGERTRIKVTLPSLTSAAESTLTVNMKMEPTEHTKINVNLTEIAPVAAIPDTPVQIIEEVSQKSESPKISTPEISEKTPEKIVLEVHEKISGSDEQEVRQTGYEAEDVTVDDANEESRKSKRKKKRKQKLKAKDGGETTDDQESSASKHSAEAEEPTKVEKEGVEKEISPDESYGSISEYDPESVRIMEEAVIQSPSPDDLKPLPSELVTTVPVMDTLYVEESEQQTSLPYEEVPKEEIQRESPPKEAVVQDEHSVQTSPTHQPQPMMEISQQTSPEPEPEHQETEAQTILIESTEVEIQTTPIKLADEEDVPVPKAEVTSEEIQTEPVVFGEKIEAPPAVETTDNTSQTTVLDTREQNLQTSPTESPEHHPRKDVSQEEDVSTIASRIVDEIVAGIPTPTATQETNTEIVTIHEATVQTTPPAATPAIQSPEHVETLQIEEVPEVSEPQDVEDSSLSTTTSEPYEIHVKASLIYPAQSSGETYHKIPENFSVEVTRSFDLEDGEGPKSFHEIVEIPSADEPPKPKSVTISLVKKTVVDELFDEPDVQEEQRKVERMLEGRLKMSQDARQSPLSNVLHLATLSESITEEPMEERLEVLQENLAELEDAIQRQDSRVIHRTVTIIFEKISVWLETIEYRVYVTRQSASSEPSERKIGEFNELRNELECIQNYVEHLRKDLEQPMQDVESENMVQCVNVIVDHLRAIDNVTQSSEMQVQDDFRRFSEYQMNVDELQMNIQQLKSNLDRIVSEEMGLDKKLHLLDEFDDINRAFGKEVQRLIHVARGLERDFPEKETPEQIFMCREMVANLDGTINIERNRLNQLVNLAQEYEQTLNEFAKIILIADSLVESQITTSNLDNLQNEIQKHRKFFVNLSHCRAILESLEMNLDPVTREKHSQLHQTLHESATTILDKASDRAQRLSMAASRWTVLERGMREEKQWLQIAQQRIPDLTEVTSTDYDQYINMYHCLSADIAHHHAKLVQLTTTAVKLQELVSASNVEDDCNEQLFMILKLKEDVALNLKKLLKFRQYWILYETTTDKIENWITTSEHHLEKIEIPKFFKEYPLEHMRLFWDIKAEFELYNSIKADAVTNLERALEVVPIADELLQKEFHQRLEDKWGSVEEKIHRIQQLIVDGMSASNVPTDEKLTLLQKELDELEKAMASVKGVIRSQDKLQLYIERMQILNSRVVIVGTELGRIGLTSSSDSERIGRLFGMSHRISMQISEELDGALVLQDQLNKISHGIIRMRLLQQSGGETLDQCEGIDLSGTEIVENALYDCQRVHGDLKTHWQGIMELRQLLHTLPMRLKISVSPVMLERDISQLQDDHVVLESRCEKILSSLRGALHLWKTFEKQLEQVQQSIQQTDYMVELLKVYGQVDYERLVKATERLEGLHGDLDSHEDLLEDLKCSAEPLVEICSAEVAHKIEVAVQETIQAWNETSQNLTDLCSKYQRAVRLWQQYRDATESLNNWVDEKESDLKVMDPNGDLQYIKECLNALPAYKERLAEVRQMVDQISADIELEPGSLLEMDVESLGARLETMKEAITVLADEAEKKLQKTAELEQEVRDSQRQLEATQKAIEDIPEEIATEEHLLNLRNHLVKLSCTQNQIQKMHSTKLEQNITTNVSIVEVLKIWQRLFKDTFQQYYRLSSTLIQNEDVDAVLKLWEDYLRHVQTFLATSIPQNYSSLSDHRHICEVHQNLLVSQKSVYEMNVKPHVAERFTELVRLHNDVLQKLNARHSEVEERIGLWDKYNREMTELLEWLKDMEQSRTRLQLSYLNLRRVPKIRQTLDSLLARVPEGEEKSHQLKQQHGVLLKFCEDALGTSIKMGHAAVNQRISNLKAALETWRDFVNRIVHLENVYQQKVAFVQDSLQATQKLYTEVSQKNQVTDGNIKQQINDLREKRIEVNKLSVDLEQIGVVLEEMKECVSPYDLKSMRQIVWILWQQQGDLNQQLGSYINNLVDKLSLWKMFNDKYTVLSAWMDHLEKRIEMGTQFVYVGEPEEIQRYIENEIATEMSFKERDRDWVLSSGRQLLTHFSDADDQSQATEIQEKLNTIIERWEKLKYLTKVRGNELKDLRLTTMRLEIRIAELRSWLFKMETDVTRPLHLDDLTEASRRKCRQEHDELQRAMEKECINFAEVLNLCDMLFKDVNTWKSHFNIGALSVAINNVEKRWGNVCNLLTVRGNKIHTMWKLFGELQKVDDDHRQWVMEKKRLVDELQRQRVPRDELAERVEFIREQIEEVRHREPLRYQQEKNYHGLVASNTLDTNNINELLGNVPAILNDWSTLLPSLMALHEKLQGDLCLYGKFVQSHEKAVLNLTQIDAHLTQVEVSTPPNAQEILSVEEELKDCSEVLETADKLGLALMETFPDVAAIQAMVDEYQNLYRDISSRLQKLREQYVVEVDESVQVNTLTFEQDSAVQVNTLTFVTAKDAYILELKSAIKEMKNNLKNLETALNDTEAKSLKTIKSNKIVAACESSVELIRHLSMLLKTECHSTDEEACVEEVNDLLTKHENLMILWRSKEQKLQELSDLGRLTCPLCTQKNWQQIDNDLWRLEQWLQFAEGTQRLQSSPPSNINELEDVIQDHREFLLDLNSHKSIVASLNVVGDHLATHTLDTERAQQLRERLERNNQRWEKVCQSAAKWQSSLQTTLMGNKEFHSIIDELCAWLEATEARIRAAEPVDLTVSRDIMLGKFRRFRDLRSELERCEPRVVSLQEAADQLLKASTAESGSEESSAVIYTSLNSRLTDLRLRLQSLRRLTGVYVVKLGAVLGVESTEISLRTASPYQTQSTNQLDEFGVPLEGAHSSPQLNEDESNGGDEINTSVLARGYRFLGRVLRASLPIQALMLLLLGVVTLVPHAEDYSCIFTNNFARSLEPMLRYPNGPPPI